MIHILKSCYYIMALITVIAGTTFSNDSAAIAGFPAYPVTTCLDAKPSFKFDFPALHFQHQTRKPVLVCLMTTKIDVKFTVSPATYQQKGSSGTVSATILNVSPGFHVATAYLNNPTYGNMIGFAKLQYGSKMCYNGSVSNMYLRCTLTEDNAIKRHHLEVVICKFIIDHRGIIWQIDNYLYYIKLNTTEIQFVTTSKVVNCWWNVNNISKLFFENYGCKPKKNVTCRINAIYVTSTFYAQPITNAVNIFVACNPPLEPSTDKLTLFPHLCGSPDHFNVIPVTDGKNFGKYNSTGWFQCPNNGTPVYGFGIKRTQPTICLPNATWEGENGLQCVKVVLLGSPVFNLTRYSTQLANFRCQLKENRSSISGSTLKIQLDSMVVQGNFTVTPDHNERNVSCILALKNEAFVTSEKKLIKVNYGPTILNLTVVSSFRKNGNSYKFLNNITLTIQCIVDSNPPSKCTWYNWDTKLTEVSPNCNLTTSFNATSNISCHASNGFGSTAIKTIHILLGSDSNFPFSTVPVRYRPTNLQEMSTQLQIITTKTKEPQNGKNDPTSGPLHALLIGFIVLISIVIVVLVVACMRK